MEISGIRVHILIGSREVLRAPRWWIESERHSTLGRAGFTLPDPTGELAQNITKGDPVTISLGYRDQAPATWSGTVEWIRPGATRDQLEIGAVDGALPLTTELITQAWENETPDGIVAWAVRKSGLPVGRIDAIGMVLPRFVASAAPVWQVARQAAHSCQRAFDLDMRRWALWLGQNGVNWGDFDEPGAIPEVATGGLLIDHKPAADAAALNLVEAWLLPGMTHSQRFHLIDTRRGVDSVVRALKVRHEGAPNRARTFLQYGVEHGRF